MGKRDTDKKLGRLSTILEIITNIGTIGSWVLGISSAYMLNIQKTPVIVPGVDIALDVGFQFALLISAMLGYIHFLKKYWQRNAKKLKLSSSFMDFSFWDLPRLKQPLLLIPIVIAFSIFIQVSRKSYWLLGTFLFILALMGYFIFQRFRYYLSPSRDYERLVEKWSSNTEWIEIWSQRIRKQLSINIGVTENDFYEAGMPKTETSRIEIIFALHKYFEKYEFEDDLVLTRVKDLHYSHPLYSYDSHEWVLLQRANLGARKHQP